MATLVFTVTNDLSYDQRMQRICTSLASNGYDVVLVGRKKTKSIPLQTQPFRQKRLNAWFQEGPGLYIEYNCRLFFYLLFLKMDVICAIDLDTILPTYFVSLLRKKKRVYDAHELFTEMKEIVSRPMILKWWMAVERFAVPKFRDGYTVNQSLVQELHRRYGVRYEMIRNMPVLNDERRTTNNDQRSTFQNDEHRTTNNDQRSTFQNDARRTTDNEQRSTNIDQRTTILYQGAVNEGRSFETLIPAMQHVNASLLICGDGNFFEQTKLLVKQYGVENKVTLLGYVPPGELKQITPTARIAVMLFEAKGMNQYHSLSNRFFDYIMASVPQVCVNYPEYKAINDRYQVALMIDDTKTATIAAALNQLLTDDRLYDQIHQNCLKARQALNWNSEEKKLITFYEKLLNESTVQVSDTRNDAIKN